MMWIEMARFRPFWMLLFSDGRSLSDKTAVGTASGLPPVFQDDRLAEHHDRMAKEAEPG